MPDAPEQAEIVGNSKDMAQYEAMIKRFIDLANELKNEGFAPPSINAALMLSSGLYATYLAVGNDKTLDAKTMDQVAGIYRKNLASVQQLKQEPATKN